MTAPFKLKHLIPSEDYECQCLIRWAQLERFKGHRLSDLLIMIPNGAYLGGDAKQRAITMAKMKRTGFKPGVFDYLLPVSTDTAPGLWLEMKRRQLGVISLEQSAFRQLMLELGWQAAIAKGWEEAREAITGYLEGA
jgi:hypothetical protein